MHLYILLDPNVIVFFTLSHKWGKVWLRETRWMQMDRSAFPDLLFWPGRSKVDKKKEAVVFATISVDLAPEMSCYFTSFSQNCGRGKGLTIREKLYELHDKLSVRCIWRLTCIWEVRRAVPGCQLTYRLISPLALLTDHTWLTCLLLKLNEGGYLLSWWRTWWEIWSCLPLGKMK